MDCFRTLNGRISGADVENWKPIVISKIAESMWSFTKLLLSEYDFSLPFAVVVTISIVGSYFAVILYNSESDWSYSFWILQKVVSGEQLAYTASTETLSTIWKD